MPYGTVSATTLQYVTKRALESNVSLDTLGIDPDLSEWLDDEGFPKVEGEMPGNLYEISVIFGGALDESFYVLTNYEINIADWIAEDCRREAAESAEHESWEIIVTEYAVEDAGAVRYRVTDESDA